VENQRTTSDQEEGRPRSHLFTVRLWSEALGDGQAEWRGEVRYVASGETRYFRNWPALSAIFLEMLSAGDDLTGAQA